MAQSSNGSRDGTLDDLPLPNVLTYRLVVLVNRLNRQATTILKRQAGLRLPEWRCMALLGSNGEMRLAEIAETSIMDKALVSRTIWDLSKKGLVATQRGEHDRRVLNVQLTPAGEAKYRATLPIMRRRLGNLMADLTPAEHRTMLRAIDKLSAAYEDWAALEDSGAPSALAQ